MQGFAAGLLIGVSLALMMALNARDKRISAELVYNVRRRRERGPDASSVHVRPPPPPPWSKGE